MAIEIINVGASPNDGNGDPIRDAFIKCNDNFDELETTKISGSGTDNYVPKFNGPDAIENSQIFDNGTNVGIGTTSPSEKFHVSGGNIIVNTDQAIGWGDRSTQIVGVTGSGGIMRFDVNDAEKMRINSSGNVGIGTSSPAAKLDVNGTIKTGQKTVCNLTSPYPGSNFGNGKVYLRLLQTSSTLKTTLKVTISGTWNWDPIFGSIEAYYSFYNSPGSLNYAFRNIIAATGLAADNLRLGNLEYENGYLSIPIYSSNSNDVSVTVECFTGGFDLSVLTFSSWISESLPAQNSVYVQTSLGIGTDSPSQKLEVNGTILSTDGSFGILALGAISTRIEGNAATREMKFYTFNSEKMIIDGLGNVGIGTSSPTTKLDVDGTVRNLNNLIYNGGSLFLRNPANTFDWALYQDSGNNLDFDFNGSNRLTVSSAGNVGIGTTTPTSRFTIDDSTAFSWGLPSAASAKIGTPGTGGSFMVMTPSLNSSYESGFAVDGTYTSGKSVINLSAFGVYSGGPYSADIAFKTATNTTLSEKMRITNDGNVGIGTTSPEECALLHVDTREKGFLPPRMDTEQRNNIPSPVEGLIIWNYDTKTIEVYDGSNWQRVAFI